MTFTLRDDRGKMQAYLLIVIIIVIDYVLEIV